MHESFGRPAFRPEPPEVLGVGVAWAFLGTQGPLRVHGPDGVIDPTAIPGLAAWLRKANQWAEASFLSGPQDHEVETLRTEYGYRPEATTEVTRSRLEWEQVYVGLLRDDPISKHELRVRVQARELIHEHLDLFNELLNEYRLSLDRALAGDPSRPGSTRPQMVALADRIPSMRIAVDLKVQLFRNAARPWTTNDLHDIDALSLAVPYCHVVLADKEMASMIKNTQADERHGVYVLSRLDELADLLPALETIARSIGGDASGWDWLGPGEGFCLSGPGPLPTTG